MLVVPDPATAFLDPFQTAQTLVLICNIRDPLTGQPYSRDARYVAQKAEIDLKSTGLADTAHSVRRRNSSSLMAYATLRASITRVTRSIRRRASGTRHERRSRTSADKPRQKEGYFPAPPVDSMQDLRTEMVLELEKLGIRVEAHHHEVATAGQAEIDMHSMRPYAHWPTT